MNITSESFSQYGYIIEYDEKKQGSFQIVLREEGMVGWRIAVSRITARNVSKLGRHPNSMESFEPVEGVTLLCAAPAESPEDFEVFLLDKPVCLHKNIWHAVFCLSEYSIVKITENLEVESEAYNLKNGGVHPAAVSEIAASRRSPQ